MITGNTLSKLRQLKGFKQNQLAKKNRYYPAGLIQNGAERKN